jgi:hypothetical protein
MVGYFLVNRSATWSMIVCSLNSITATGSHAFTPESNSVNETRLTPEFPSCKALSIEYYT